MDNETSRHHGSHLARHFDTIESTVPQQTQPQFVWETHHNYEVRTFHARVKFPYIELGRLPTDVKDRSLRIFVIFFTSILAIPGVEKFSSFGSYKITIEKGVAFRWEEIAPEIEKLFDTLQQALAVV